MGGIAGITDESRLGHRPAGGDPPAGAEVVGLVGRKAARRARRRISGPLAASMTVHLLAAVVLTAMWVGGGSTRPESTLSLGLPMELPLEEDSVPPPLEPPQVKPPSLEVEELVEIDPPELVDPRFEDPEEPRSEAPAATPEFADAVLGFGPPSKVRPRPGPSGPVASPVRAQETPESAESGEGRGVSRGASVLSEHCPPPAYPARARNLGLEGRVDLNVSVDSGGRVTAVEVARSSGSGILDRAAQSAVATWRFRPALRGGRAVATTVVLPIVFRLGRE